MDMFDIDDIDMIRYRRYRRYRFANNDMFEDFWDLKFGRLVDTSKEYIKVIIVHLTAHFFFSFVYVMYLNIASHVYGKQIKSNLSNKLYLRMIFIRLHLNRFGLHECRTMTLKDNEFRTQ